MKIQAHTNINKPSFVCNRHLYSNPIQGDTVNFSSNEKNNTNDIAAKDSSFVGINVFTPINQYIKNLLGTNKNKNIYKNTRPEELANVIKSNGVNAKEELDEQEEIRRMIKEAAEYKKMKKRMEAELEKEMKEAVANQKPTFPKYTNEELKDMFNKFKNEDSTLRQSRFSSMIDNTYINLRYSGSHTTEESINGDFNEVLPSYYSSDEGITVYRSDSNWIWHDIKGCKRIGKDRVSLSVVADIDLLHKLDTLLLKGTYEDDDTVYALMGNQHTKGCYKTESTANAWCRRQDPITMYFDEKVSPQMLDAIATVTKKYRRIPNRKLPGAIPDKPWMANERYITQSQINSLVKEANEVDKDLAKAIEKYLSNKASTGMYHSCKKVLDDYKHYKTI